MPFDATSTEVVKIKVLGDITALSEGLQKSINKAVDNTSGNTGIVFNIAFNYGGRDELVKAVRNIALEVKNGNINVEDINQELIMHVRIYVKGDIYMTSLILLITVIFY